MPADNRPVWAKSLLFGRCNSGRLLPVLQHFRGARKNPCKKRTFMQKMRNSSVRYKGGSCSTSACPAWKARSRQQRTFQHTSVLSSANIDNNFICAPDSVELLVAAPWRSHRPLGSKTSATCRLLEANVHGSSELFGGHNRRKRMLSALKCKYSNVVHSQPRECPSQVTFPGFKGPCWRSQIVK